MKKYIIEIIALIYSFLGANMLFAADTWTQKTDFGGTERGYAIGFSIGSKGYIGTGGAGPLTPYKKDFWEYDPTANTWTQKADFGGTARKAAIGFSIGSKGYIGTGSDSGNSYTKNFWEYDPVANTWTQKANFGGTARAEAVGFSIGTKGYIGPGANGNLSINDFWEYNPVADTWTQKADFGGTERWGTVGFSIGTKGYIGTGYDGSPTWKKDFWEYEPAANTWTQKADFGGTGMRAAIGFSIGSKGYIGTGYHEPALKKDFWEYDPTANTWTQKADFGGTARLSAIGFSIGSKGYIGTGLDSDNSPSYKKDFWEYDPSAVHAGVIQVPQTGQAACYDASGTVIACSGTGQDGELQMGASLPSPRFTDKGDQTVLDNLTGLNWAKDGNVLQTRDPGFDADGPAGNGEVTWQHALDYIKKLNQENYLGHNDWRLPNINELESLVNIGQPYPYSWLNANSFTNSQGGFYWSSSSSTNSDFVWLVRMYEGFVGQYGKSNNNLVWPVRSGQSGSSGSSIISLPRTGQTTCYSATGSSVTCTGTGQDGELQMGAAWPGTRFADNSDQTVSDNLTGLIWTKDGKTPGPVTCGPGSSKSWQDALDYVKCLNTNNYLGRTDWRLPNRKELGSLVHVGQSNTANWLNSQGMSNVQADHYWSSDTVANTTDYLNSAWTVYLSTGGGYYPSKSSTYPVWPVRSGQPGTGLASLTISKSGSGTVTSAPTGISCGSDCTENYTSGTSVTLTATPASGSTFSSWSGCDSTSNNTCTVAMTTAKNVTATFNSVSSTSTPTVTTSPTLSITSTSATLTGIVNPKGGATTYYFQYGTTSNYDQNTTSAILASGTTAQSVQTAVSGLKSNTTYYCRIVAANSAGTSLGGERTFKTLPGANTRTMKAIIVAGGSPSPSNNIWEATKKAANNAYNALIQQGIDKTRIRYLSQSMYDADGDGAVDISDLATGDNLEYAVTNWASTDTEDVLLYLVDHGTRGYFVIKEGEYVSALELKSWLDTLQQYISGRVIVIYDACYAGTFIPVLKAPAGQERIVLTSTGMEAQAAFITNGTLSFSNLFWNEIHNGSKFYDAYIAAKRSMAYIYQYQMAQIDSNGNGTADEKEDTTLAGSIQIGNEIGTGAPPPTIGSASPTQNISGTSALIYADNVTATAGIQRVWAVVTPPNYSGNSTGAAVTDLPTFDLEKTGTTHYEKTYSGFTVSGTYSITIFAMDDTFLVSQPVSTQVVVTASVGMPGDLDGDGAVTVADATIALQVMAGMQPATLRTDFATSGADIDGDGKITQSELLYILQKTAGAR